MTEAQKGYWSVDLAKVAVTVDVFMLMPILQLVVLNVQPQCLHDGSPGLGVHTEEPSQPRVQLVLGRLWRDQGVKSEQKPSCHTGNYVFTRAAPGNHLMIQHKQKSTLDIKVPRAFHLEAICLLGCRQTVPLKGGRVRCMEQYICFPHM